MTSLSEGCTSKFGRPEGAPEGEGLVKSQFKKLVRIPYNTAPAEPMLLRKNNEPGSL